MYMAHGENVVKGMYITLRHQLSTARCSPLPYQITLPLKSFAILIMIMIIIIQSLYSAYRNVSKRFTILRTR